MKILSNNVVTSVHMLASLFVILQILTYSKMTSSLLLHMLLCSHIFGLFLLTTHLLWSGVFSFPNTNYALISHDASSDQYCQYHYLCTIILNLIVSAGFTSVTASTSEVFWFLISASSLLCCWHWQFFVCHWHWSQPDYCQQCQDVHQIHSYNWFREGCKWFSS